MQRQYKFIFSRPKRKPLSILLDHCSDWTVIYAFSEEYREMYAHSETTEHNHMGCTNKMPSHFSWKVNKRSLLPLFPLKSCVLLKSYTTLSGFTSTKGKDHGRILLAVPLNSRSDGPYATSNLQKQQYNKPTHKFILRMVLEEIWITGTAELCLWLTHLGSSGHSRDIHNIEKHLLFWTYPYCSSSNVWISVLPHSFFCLTGCSWTDTADTQALLASCWSNTTTAL